MCGIICEICYSKQSSIIHDDKELISRVLRRGPDSNDIKQLKINDELVLSFFGAVLWMQGMTTTSQPVENDFGVLLFNGDIFDESWDYKMSDTQILFNKLSETKGDEHQMLSVIKSLKGPFSLIYFCKVTQNVYFARDRIGRNSLLFHYDDKKIVISSVLSKNYKCVEISAQYIYRLNIMSKETWVYSWHDTARPLKPFSLDHWKENYKLERSDKDFESENDNLINNEENIRAYIENVSKSTKNKELLMTKLLEHPTIKRTAEDILQLLLKSVELRIQRQPNKCKTCLKHGTLSCDHSAVGILFSGGLDCTILASLADKYVPENQSIDLMNVAFQKDNTNTYEVPDRVTGRQSLQELQMICPKRRWIFCEINVSKKELAILRKNDIGNLLFPLQTVLDENLGSALWFAARGQDETGTSPCRTVLLGSGADELFGGYTRHRNMYRRRGWAGLQQELKYDWARISYRNLARDNRIICDHGRQPRMPYLDNDFSSYVEKLKPWLRCYPSENMEVGVGEKLMLRLVAFYLGLKQVATFPKRALQFGSRIANKKDKGDDISEVFK